MVRRAGLTGPVVKRLTRRQRARLFRFGVYGVTLAAVGLIAVAADWGAIRRAFLDTEIFTDQFPLIITRAARNMLTFAALAFVLALAWGLMLALMRLSTIRPYRWFAAIWIDTFRGIPALTTIILVGYAIPIALQYRIPGRYGPGAVALAIVYSAYMAETIRAGIEAVPRGQMEAARSLGMSYPVSMTFVVVPQAFRIVIPPLTNELISLVKDTSLLFVLGTTVETIEITQFARDTVGRTFNATPITAAALVYLAITVPLTRMVGILERRARRAR